MGLGTEVSAQVSGKFKISGRSLSGLKRSLTRSRTTSLVVLVMSFGRRLNSL
jgi:hypothetical protein